MTQKHHYSTEPEHFILSPETEPLLERVLFNNRSLVLMVLTLLTLVFAFGLTQIRLDSSIEKYIPLQHPYIQNYLVHKDDMKSGMANIKIAVAAVEGDIFDDAYLQTLSKINDDVFFVTGVDRSGMQSLWTPNTRWTEVTEEGFQGGPVIPANYDGSPASIEQVRQNILKSGQVGRLVANDFVSTVIDVPLLERDPETGEKLGYQALSHQLEERIRDHYQSDSIRIYITGTPKKLGDLLDGAVSIGYFFLAAMLMTAVLLYLYSRCPKGTLVPIAASLIAVVWQLGALALLGFSIDLYSVLVPFLVFAIGISHGVQLINGIAIHSGQGLDKMSSARQAFRGLYVPGMLALLSDAMGFLTLLFIDIGVIQELAIAASVGVAMIIVTNLVLVPIVMSYIGISPAGIAQAQKAEKANPVIWQWLGRFTDKRYAVTVLSLTVVLGAFGVYYSQDLEIGDLDKGAPELRADSRYNLDNDFMVASYSTSSDVMVVMAETPIEMCNTFKVMDVLDRFMWRMENVPGVQSALSLVTVSKLVTKAMNEGNLNWYALSRNQTILNTSIQRAPGGLLNADCSMAPVIIYLNDHKAETLQTVVDAVEAFKSEYDDQVDEMYFGMRADAIQDAIAEGKIDAVPMRLQLASGNAGIEAATNQVIADAQDTMLIFVYVVVFSLCLLTFRSLTAVACILLPLALTSILGQALMTWLGIGVKVATLPVIALGVGIGVDYGIYIYNRLEALLISGLSLKDAYLETLRSTGKAVSFTGVTLAIGVATWMLSPIKFQADMGILLTFMFLWNMLGALVLLPALASMLLNPEKIRERHQRVHQSVPPAV
ncbi:MULTISPECIES: RND family transporter [unclassified Oceanobacter]|uniref:efflux RND transporter permease subunit n=1 Tax=unclassified Oceanobacter TaxID=2620260 RepID=UPI0027376F98|nr:MULTISPECIES: MMPL family transporter [unclassified Oceanobacter]MDP2607535.1 MMPL family transporter [Oceanobacter sp. 1_MG-2023]MDP2610803.1 MMPL family transporter [Oceanobacter sp. 2_MG-2023]